MLDVEDWAEIRRLHRGERLPIKVIAQALACVGYLEEYRAGGADVRRAAEVSAGIGWVGGGRGRAADPGAAAGISDDAGDGDRSAGGLDAGDDGVHRWVRELRPVCLPPDPASPTAYVAGEIAQHDFWFPDIEFPVGFGRTRTARQLLTDAQDDGDGVIDGDGLIRV